MILTDSTQCIDSTPRQMSLLMPSNLMDSEQTDVDLQVIPQLSCAHQQLVNFSNNPEFLLIFGYNILDLK